MKLSISNIAWTKENDELVYSWMKEFGYKYLEIAPTRIFPDNPYDHLKEASEWAKTLPFKVCSMQSIWYGKTGNIFDQEEREDLIAYTKKAILFAETIGCKNLVFGNPKNRQMPDGCKVEDIIPFFNEIGDFAYLHHTCIGMEANPAIYHTNFINKTADAIGLIKEVNSLGFKLNLDIGTMIENQEDINILKDNIRLINHVHISEPFLKPIQKRNLHLQLKNALADYSGVISIEMGKNDDLSLIKNCLCDIQKIFCGE